MTIIKSDKKEYDYILDSEATGFKYYLTNNQDYWRDYLVQYAYQGHNIKYTKNNLPKDNDNIILDIGTNIGQTALEYTRFSKKVIGFEMITSLCNQANNNFKLNNIDEDDCIAYNIALGNSKGNFNYVLGTTNDGTSYLANVNGQKLELGDNRTQVECETITLDEFLSNNYGTLPKINFMKLDVEGYELMVLQGAVETVTKYKPMIQVECNNPISRYGYSGDDLFNFIRSLGYVGKTRFGDEIVNYEQVDIIHHSDTFWFSKNN